MSALLRGLLYRVMDEASDGTGGSGGGEGGDLPPPAGADGSFTRAQVEEIRKEAQRHRLSAKEAKAALAEANRLLAINKEAVGKAASEKVAADLTAAKEAVAGLEKTTKELRDQMAEQTTKANQRVIAAELRAAATAVGMVDMDGLKLADLSAVKLNDDGVVEGVDAALTALKAAKPYLFGKPPENSGSTHQPPKPTDAGLPDARKMTDKEYSAARAAVTRGK